MPLGWLLMRSSGIVALVLLTMSVVLGLVSPTLRPSWRLVAVTAHRAAAAVGSALIVIHIGLAVTDEFVDVPTIAVAVPGTSPWEPLGIGLAAIAVDLLLVLLATAWLRVRIGPVWRRIHLVAYPIWGLVVAHALLAGTDETLMYRIGAASSTLVLAALATRLLRGGASGAPPALVTPAAPVGRRASAPAGSPAAPTRDQPTMIAGGRR